METLKEVNQTIQKAGRLRIGRSKVRLRIVQLKGILRIGWSKVRLSFGRSKVRLRICKSKVSLRIGRSKVRIRIGRAGSGLVGHSKGEAQDWKGRLRIVHLKPTTPHKLI